MILQALVQHYEDLVAQGKIARPGWSAAKISFALCISQAGELEQVVSVKTEQAVGKKTALVPQSMELPAPVKRTVGIDANFLWDNSSYLLGADGKGKPQRAMECFAACKDLHLNLLAEADCPAARALAAFFQSWEPVRAKEHPALRECWDELLKDGGNLVFRCDGAYVHEDPAIRQVWQRHYDMDSEDEARQICLVTGERVSAQNVHPAIKGVPGAQSSGAALVSFNAPAFCSYGKEQNLNAPVGKYAAFAYTSALNHLIADREHVCRAGDTTVVCWAEGGEPAYQGLAGGFIFGKPAAYSEGELRGMVRELLLGRSVVYEQTLLDKDRPFYILGLAPNAARLSVRFFLRNSFGGFLENVQRHYKRLEIDRPSWELFPSPSLGRLLDATVNHNTKTPTPTPNMAGEVMRAVLNDTPYPATLLNGVELRVRAEREVTWSRAAILKAYYIKNPHPAVPKEVLTVSLNEESTNIPYTLGRLFSVLEDIQEKANPGINATIKDKYFNAASATPSRVFPVLIDLAQKHLRKLDGGQKNYYSQKLTALLAVLGESFPAHLSMPQQGSFQLGYYHQTQKRYEKKEDK